MAAAEPPNVEVDNKAESDVINFLNGLPEKSDATVRFFQRNGYYSAHGQDAMLVAKEYYRTVAVIKYFGGDKTPYVNISNQMFEAIIRDLLLVRQYRVELYAKDGKGPWSLRKKATPGNIQDFEDELFTSVAMSDSALVLSLKLASDQGERVVGVGFGDATSRTLGFCEFPDNDQFSNLEALIVQIGAKECLVAPEPNNPEYQKMYKLLERSGMMITERKKSDFTAKDLDQDLERLLAGEARSAQLAQTNDKYALGSLNAVIKYLELLGDESNFNQFKLVNYDLSQYMKLDAAAVRALNLFPSPQDGGNKTMCVLGLFNKCKTPQGQRLLTQWLKQPLLDVNRITERQNMVEAFLQDTSLRQALQEEHLRAVPDVYRLVKKFMRKKGTLQDCVRLYQLLERVPGMVNALKAYEGPHTDLMHELFIKPLETLLADFGNYTSLIETTIDLDHEGHDVMIKPSFDDRLKEIRNSMDELEDELPEIHKKAGRDLKLEPGKVLKLEHASHLGHFFRVSRKEEAVLRNNKKYTAIDTQKSGVRFRNEELRVLNEKLTALREEYEQQQSELAGQVIDVAAGYSPPMERLNDVIALLDTLVSLATAAANAPVEYVRPTIREKGSGVIRLVGSRHACLEVQDDVNFIANDVTLVKGESSFQIITGPNMGGKSTYIRQIGMIVLLAQIGSFVPCTEAEITVCDKILARVGAGDSQLRGVSTFMAEMLETASILKSATPDSLIIIDELGRGTSTYDGFGLAWAISEHIVKEIHAFCMFATHFHELTALAEEVPSVSNMHVTALTSNNKLTLLYRVRPGVCDQSFGIHVAELARFPEEVVELAKRKAEELEDFQGSNNEEDNEARKKHRQDKEEGERLINKFMDDVAALPVDSMSDEEVQQRIWAMKDDLMAQGNRFIQHVLAAA